jgi:hypothetical protein
MKAIYFLILFVLPMTPSVRPQVQAPPNHAITVRVALKPDADGRHVTLLAQNGSQVVLPRSELVGKRVLVATTAAGEAAANGQLIDVGTVTLGPDLTATFTTPPRYADGAWEVSCVIAMTASQRIPAPGDLAAFDNSPPPAGEDPPTGASVRVHVRGAETTVTLTNRHFIRFAG